MPWSCMIDCRRISWSSGKISGMSVRSPRTHSSSTSPSRSTSANHTGRHRGWRMIRTTSPPTFARNQAKTLAVPSSVAMISTMSSPQHRSAGRASVQRPTRLGRDQRTVSTDPCLDQRLRPADRRRSGVFDRGAIRLVGRARRGLALPQGPGVWAQGSMALPVRLLPEK